jgi:hypothetical protein
MRLYAAFWIPVLLLWSYCKYQSKLFSISKNNARTMDVSAAVGYRSFLIPFFKPQLTAGYSFVNKNYGESFFHIDPSLGFDLGIGNISAGYSFRTVKIDNKIGGFTFSLGISPLVFFGNSKTKTTLSSVSKASRSQVKSLRKKK